MYGINNFIIWEYIVSVIVIDVQLYYNRNGKLYGILQIKITVCFVF